MRHQPQFRPYATPVEHLHDESRLIRLRLDLAQTSTTADRARDELADSISDLAHRIGSRIRSGPPLPISRLDEHCDGLPESLYVALVAAVSLVVVDPSLANLVDWQPRAGVRVGSMYDLVGDGIESDELAEILMSGPLTTDGLVCVRWSMSDPDNPFEARLRLTAPRGLAAVLGVHSHHVDLREADGAETCPVLHMITAGWRRTVVEGGGR